MASRFIGVVGDKPLRAQIAARLRVDEAFTTAIDLPQLLVAVEAGGTVLPLDNRGLVIGTLFMLGRGGPLATLASADIERIACSQAGCLTRGFWGGYVAIVAEPGGDAVRLVRAPFGELPCFYAATADGWLFASDVGALQCLGGRRFDIDWPALARFIAATDVRDDDTCLAGLKELRGGDRLILDPSSARSETIWSPWPFAGTDRQLADPAEASHRLRGEVVHVVGARAALAEKSALLLSGGLDSSAIAAGAAAQRRDLLCVNLTTRNPSGDERRYARSVSSHTGLPLVELAFQEDAVDLDRSAAASLPRPVARAFEYEARRQAWIEARRYGAGQVLSGGGGDNVFCSPQSVTPAVDCLLALDDRTEFWRVAREICELTGASLWTVARRAWLRSWKPRAPTRAADLRFLSAHAVAIASGAPAHPWLERPGSVLPGKAAHVRLLIAAQALTEDANPQEPFPLAYPLMSQPVVELCLRIPTWQWLDRGCNRAVARRAFQGELPAEVAWRRSKGSPDSFVIELLDANRGRVRAMLLEGRLAAEGMLDREAIARFIDDPRPAYGSDHGRIMRLVDIEAWSRCWPA